MRKIKFLKDFRSFYLLMLLGALLFSLISVRGFSKETDQGLAQDMSDKSYKEASKSSQYHSIEDIDKKINELEEMKRGYESKAIKQVNQAQRLQFIEGELQAAKRYWRAAEDNRKIVTRIQKEIDELKIERMKLQKKKG
ncbi:MAG: hypothetical protein KR126chlam4_00950 [Candidatus Anoxychlamydiales bacterium]|nr:hypothetical protein [Candidatus Anoxychlamydiales bacterium]NGX41114.1 hypothetical protein [Candidatus Anoxychlamydiales bacterium]HEU64423.1 hypothetical protein [Chlamydiota bacterium]